MKKSYSERGENRRRIEMMVTAAMFLAIGVVLPSITGAIKEIGDSLLPMHLVIMLCGAICGWKYALPIGLVMPFFRSLIFGMPRIYPNAIWMALELAAYGFVIGIMYSRRKKYSRAYLYASLVTSMLVGRIVWGVSKAVLLGVAGKPFGIEAFWIGGFVDAIPGIIIQLILVPLIVELVERGRVKRK